MGGETSAVGPMIELGIRKPSAAVGCREGLWESMPRLRPWQGAFSYESVVKAHKLFVKGGECDVVHEQSVVMSAFPWLHL